MTTLQRIWSCACGACCLVLLASCTRERAMYGYYLNHPRMRDRLLSVRTIYMEEIRGTGDEEEAKRVRQAIVEELDRRGRGRFRIASSASDSDAVIEIDMEEALGPMEDEPLPFELEPKIKPKSVYMRMRLVEPGTGLLIYKTDTKEFAEVHVDSVEKAAFTVVSNLMREINLASPASRR